MIVQPLIEELQAIKAAHPTLSNDEILKIMELKLLWEIQNDLHSNK